MVFDKTVPLTKVLVSEGRKKGDGGREEKSFSKSSLAAFSSGQRIGGSVCSTQVLFTFGGRINEQPWRAFSPTPTRGSTRKTAHFDTGITAKSMWPYNWRFVQKFHKTHEMI